VQDALVIVFLLKSNPKLNRLSARRLIFVLTILFIL